MHLIVKKSDEFGKPFHQKFAKLEVSFFLLFRLFLFLFLLLLLFIYKNVVRLKIVHECQMINIIKLDF